MAIFYPVWTRGEAGWNASDASRNEAQWEAVGWRFDYDPAGGGAQPPVVMQIPGLGSTYGWRFWIPPVAGVYRCEVVWLDPAFNLSNPHMWNDSGSGRGRNWESPNDVNGTPALHAIFVEGYIPSGTANGFMEVNSNSIITQFHEHNYTKQPCWTINIQNSAWRNTVRYVTDPPPNNSSEVTTHTAMGNLIQGVRFQAIYVFRFGSPGQAVTRIWVRNVANAWPAFSNPTAQNTAGNFYTQDGVGPYLKHGIYATQKRAANNTWGNSTLQATWYQIRIAGRSSPDATAQEMFEYMRDTFSTGGGAQPIVYEAINVATGALIDGTTVNGAFTTRFRRADNGTTTGMNSVTITVDAGAPVVDSAAPFDFALDLSDGTHAIDFAVDDNTVDATGRVSVTVLRPPVVEQTQWPITAARMNFTGSGNLIDQTNLDYGLYMDGTVTNFGIKCSTGAFATTGVASYAEGFGINTGLGHVQLRARWKFGGANDNMHIVACTDIGAWGTGTGGTLPARPSSGFSARIRRQSGCNIGEFSYDTDAGWSYSDMGADAVPPGGFSNTGTYSFVFTITLSPDTDEAIATLTIEEIAGFSLTRILPWPKDERGRPLSGAGVVWLGQSVALTRLEAFEIRTRADVPDLLAPVIVGDDEDFSAVNVAPGEYELTFPVGMDEG